MATAPDPRNGLYMRVDVCEERTKGMVGKIEGVSDKVEDLSLWVKRAVWPIAIGIILLVLGNAATFVLQIDRGAQSRREAPRYDPDDHSRTTLSSPVVET